MTDKHGVHPFAVEHAADGQYYLHKDRAPNKHTHAFDVNRWLDPFDTEQEARAFAKEHFQASDDDFAAHPMAR
ncbi:hypothetical protein [Sphingomonas sp. DC2300-3]|uniref:hypothetical protein n=1 Tax=unclassified Sphingomonas TaxID=196159 RepID=UPI003CF1E8D2